MSTVDTVRDRLDALPDVGLVVGFIASIWAVMLVLAIAVGGANWANLAAGFIGSVTVLIGGYAILALALNLQWGYTGLFNIGIAGFMAVGAYTTAILTAPTDPAAGAVPGLGLPLWVGLIGGMVMAAIVGGLAALPALRLKADYLAIVTVAFSEIIRLVVNWSGLAEFSLFGVPVGTGGATGISFKSANDVAATLINGVGQPIVTAAEGVGVSGPNLANLTYGILLLLVVAGSYWVLARITNSPFGRVLKAIREDETVTQSLGKDTRQFKIKTFMIGCALMGLAGVLFRGQAGYVSPQQFRPTITFYVFAASSSAAPGPTPAVSSGRRRSPDCCSICRRGWGRTSRWAALAHPATSSTRSPGSRHLTRSPSSHTPLATSARSGSCSSASS